jgi:CheY-like chemotaxis protein
MKHPAAKTDGRVASARRQEIAELDAQVADLIRDYLASRRNDVERIAAALTRRDLAAIRAIGHNMRGSGRIFGFSRLTVMGTDLQNAADAADYEAIERLQRRLASYVTRAEIGGATRAPHVAAERAVVPEPDRGRGGREGTAEHILVADDQETNRLLLRHYLEAEGYAVTGVGSGEEVLAALDHRPLPAAVLLDVLMPGADGFEVCRRIKSDPETLAIPVVLVTGLDNRSDRARAAAAGADDYLPKPVNRKRLVARMRALVAPGARQALGAAK